MLCIHFYRFPVLNKKKKQTNEIEWKNRALAIRASSNRKSFCIIYWPACRYIYSFKFMQYNVFPEFQRELLFPAQSIDSKFSFFFNFICNWRYNYSFYFYFFTSGGNSTRKKHDCYKFFHFLQNRQIFETKILKIKYRDDSGMTNH